MIESPRVATSTGADAASKMSVHAAGLFGAGSPVAAGQGDWPSGVDATPGMALASLVLLHAAPGPDAGHGSAPFGTLTLASSAVPGVVHPCVEAAAPAAQTAAPCPTVRPTSRLDGGEAAKATKVIWFETRTNAIARVVFGRNLKSNTKRRSKCK